MRWDPLLADAMARELHGTLHRARVRALLLEPESRRVLLFLREGTLAVELHPTAGWISWTDPVDPVPGARPLAARVRRVTALPDESALVLSLQRVRGKDEGVELVVEFTGNRWNALVVGVESRRIRHVLLPREERERSLTVGAPYLPPPGTGRVEPPSLAWWMERVAGRDRGTLLRTVARTSSLNAPLFLEGGGEGEPEGGPEAGSEGEPEGEPEAEPERGPDGGPDGGPEPRVLGEEGFLRWRTLVDPEAWRPLVLETPRGPQPYPLALPGMEAEGVPDLLEAFRRARLRDEGSATPAVHLPTALLARGEARVERLRRRVAGMERELEGARDPEPVRSLGDLLLARFGEIPRGATRVTLTDFHGNPVEVELDPALPPHGNAKRYYDEAGRLDRVREGIPRRIAAAREELAGWEALVEGVREGALPPGALEERLGPEGSGARGAGGRRDVPSLPYRRYRSSGGLEIRVGRGARQNDDLTFRHSAPDDIWLHVREAPGAHVILRWGREGNPPGRDLEEAAVLAALGSDARHAGVVPVDWTRRKYVRKPRKAAPGAVIPGQVQTLFVEPDPGVEGRLREEG